MRVLVCGSRGWKDSRMIRDNLKNLENLNPTIVHGGCTGADLIAEKIANKLGYKVEEYPAEWTTYGRQAGPIRNQQMLDSGIDLVLAYPLPESRGTWDTIRRARKMNVPVSIADCT